MFGWQPSLWQAVLTMRPYLLPMLCLCLACSGQDDIYHDELPKAVAVEHIERIEAVQQLTSSAGVAELIFELPAQTQSFALFVEGSPQAEYLITELEGPDGALVRAEATDEEIASGLGAAAGPFFSANRSVGDHAGTSLLVPNDPMIKVTAGPWRATIQSTRSQEHTITVARIEQRAQGRPSAVTIPLSIHLTGAEGMRSGEANEHVRLQRAQSQLTTIFSPVGITFSPIIYVDISDDYQVIEDIELNDAQGLDLLSQGSAEVGLNIFIIERFDSGDEILGTIGGVSAAIPGDPRARQRFAGVVVATSFSEDDPSRDLLGLTMAHEIGHFLGLFHTTEAAGFVDNISDTQGEPQRNLMHHFSQQGFDQLTEHQGMVVRAHPAGAAP